MSEYNDGPIEMSVKPEFGATSNRLEFDEIAREAYAVYLEHGSAPGRDVENWLEAEARLIDRLEGNADRQASAVVQQSDGTSRHRSGRTRSTRKRAVRRAKL